MTQQNSKYRLCGNRDETINHIISKCSKLAQKYQTSNDWVGKVIHWEMCKQFKFDHTNKLYIHNPASVLENDTYKLSWYFDVQTDHIFSARRQDLIIINKKENLQKYELCCPGWPGIKLKGCEKKDKYLDPASHLKKIWNMKVTNIQKVIGTLGTVTKGLLKVRGREVTIPTTTLLWTARILRRVLMTWGDLLSLKLQWKTISLNWCEKLISK